MKGPGGGNNRLTPDVISLTRSQAVFFLSQQSQHKWIWVASVYGYLWSCTHLNETDRTSISKTKYFNTSEIAAECLVQPDIFICCGTNTKLQLVCWFILTKKLDLLYFLLLPCINYPNLLNLSTINQVKSIMFPSKGLKHLTILSEISSQVFISSY